MRAYMSVLHLSNRSLPHENVRILKSFNAKNNIQSELEGDIIIVQYEKEKDIEYCYNILNEFAYEQAYRKKAKFPLQNTPILIGNIWVVNSAVLNLNIAPDQYMNYLNQEGMLEKLKRIIDRGFVNMLMPDDDDVVINYYRKKAEDALGKATKQWFKWKESEKLVFSSN